MNLSKSVGATKMAVLPCLLLFPTTPSGMLVSWLARNSFQRYRALEYASTVSSPNTRVSFLTCHYNAAVKWTDQPVAPTKCLTAAFIAFLLAPRSLRSHSQFPKTELLPTFSQVSLQQSLLTGATSCSLRR